MKVAVYSIAKDEAAHVERWASSAADADHIVLLDTGSTDGTPDVAEALGVDVWVRTFRPWRFDHARNAALALVPDDVDYCIALDLEGNAQFTLESDFKRALLENFPTE